MQRKMLRNNSRSRTCLLDVCKMGRAAKRMKKKKGKRKKTGSNEFYEIFISTFLGELFIPVAEARALQFVHLARESPSSPSDLAITRYP
jgi:hypothetical protein